MTNAHEEYLKKLSKYRKTIKLTRGLMLILFLSIWEIAARLDLIDEFFFSSPMGIGKWYYKAIATGELFTHIGCTLFETILSFFLVMFFSILIASILWFSRPLADIFEPSLVILNSLPNQRWHHSSLYGSEPELKRLSLPEFLSPYLVPSLIYLHSLSRRTKNEKN